MDNYFTYADALSKCTVLRELRTRKNIVKILRCIAEGWLRFNQSILVPTLYGNVPQDVG